MLILLIDNSNIKIAKFNKSHQQEQDFKIKDDNIQLKSNKKIIMYTKDRECLSVRM